MEADKDYRGTKAKGTCCGLVESVFAGRRRGSRTDKSRIRAAMRNYGAMPLGAGSLQLFRAGYGKHGSDCALRHARAEREVAEAVAGRRDSFVLCDDRAGCGVVRCHQHRIQYL